MSARKDRWSSLVLLVFGLLMAFQASKLTVWLDDEPRQGFFPLLIAVIIVGLSLLNLIKSIVSVRSQEQRLKEKREWHAGLWSVVAYLALMLLYFALLDRAGFLITSVLFLAVMLKHIEKQTWKVTALVGLLSVAMGYGLFVYLLKVPLPKGLLAFL